MTPDELHVRYTQEIEARGRDDKYIDGLEERELLTIAQEHGYSTDEARRHLVDTCKERGYVIEAAIVQRIRTALRQHRHITRRQFEALVNETRPILSGTTRGERDVRKLVLTTLADSDLPIRRGWFGDWYAKARREAGA